MTLHPPRLSQADLTRLMRHDFASFIAAAFVELNPGTSYLHNWHIDVLAARLTAFAQGKTTRLVIMLPPRSLKSHCASVSLIAWLLGQDPTKRIICASYSQDLADFHARACLKLMQSSLYRHLFPATQLSTSRPATAEFFTTLQGMRLATSVGGTLTGKGGDFVIIDDPLKPEDAMSDTLRNHVNEWYDGTMISRLNNKATGGVLIIMQRLHEDDLVGHVLQQHGWEVLRLPAIADTDEEFRIDTPLGHRTFKRQEGEALHPERESIATLDQIRTAQGEYHFAAQYQQLPAPRGGGLLKTAWLQYYAAGRLLGLHNLGRQGRQDLPAGGLSGQAGFPRPAEGRNPVGGATSSGLRPGGRPVERHAAHSGTPHPRRHDGHGLQAQGRQGGALPPHYVPVRDGKGAYPTQRAVARGVRLRAHGLPDRAARRPGRLDDAGAWLDSR
jgi:hypothetical protein